MMCQVSDLRCSPLGHSHVQLEAPSLQPRATHKDLWLRQSECLGKGEVQPGKKRLCWNRTGQSTENVLASLCPRPSFLYRVNKTAVKMTRRT